MTLLRNTLAEERRACGEDTDSSKPVPQDTTAAHVEYLHAAGLRLTIAHNCPADALKAAQGFLGVLIAMKEPTQ